MSADNWAMCPQCAARRVADLQADQEALDAAYGKVSLAEFDSMRAAIRSKAETRVEPTFREDYEIYGAEEGTVHVSYSGGCRECGLGVKFADEHPMTIRIGGGPS